MTTRERRIFCISFFISKESELVLTTGWPGSFSGVRFGSWKLPGPSRDVGYIISDEVDVISPIAETLR